MHCGRRPVGRRRLRRNHKPYHMARLFSLLTFLLTTAAFVVGIFYFIAKLIGQIAFDPGSKAWKKTIEKLQARIRSQGAGALIPWDAEMLSLLSLNQSKVKKPGWWDSTSEGVYMSIFQEPVLAYAGQKSGNTAVFVARSSKQEYILRQKQKETEVWIDNKPFGVFISDVLLAAGSSSKLLAEVDVEKGEAQWPVKIGNEVVAAINNPARAEEAGPNPRALSFFRKLNAEEEDIVLAVTLVYLLKA